MAVTEQTFKAITVEEINKLKEMNDWGIELDTAFSYMAIDKRQLLYKKTTR